MKRKIKKIAFIALFFLIIACIWHRNLLLYAIRQGYGQAKILWNTQEVKEILQENSTPDSLRQRLVLSQEIKKFAEDSLNIKVTKNYTTFYDQKEKPLLWVVTACPPFRLQAYEWSFGFLGKFSYKGHFERFRAEADSAEMAKKGYDTDIREVSAWSTLGFFKDPLLSSMLALSEGELANVIIHELTHTTLYVKDDVDFNENLASFIGDKGALLFLKQKFGIHSLPYQNYIKETTDDSLFYQYILSQTPRLHHLYSKPSFAGYADTEKKRMKEALIAEIVQGLVQVPFLKRKYNPQKLARFKPNNTFFMDYLRYRAQQTDFEKILQKDFGRNLKNYMQYLKKTYPSL